VATPRDQDPVPSLDPRWQQTIQNVSDAGLSIHVRPPATHDDVLTLLQTIPHDDAAREKPSNDSTLVLSQPADAGTPAPLSDGRDEREGGVVGHDYFTFQAVLGEGGMGRVYNARQESVGREVAVKTLRDESMRDPSLVTSFLREALTTGTLSHPNIIPLYLFGRDARERPFMVLKRVRGRPWNALLASPAASSGDAAAPFDLRRHLEIFLKVCDAVAFAHAHHIVHRDLKPANIMIGDFGEVMLMDWGLALDVSPAGAGRTAAPRHRASTIAGTPAYMAPEMVLGDVSLIGPSTDIYLLGSILYEITTGRPPHTGGNVMAVLMHAASGQLERMQPRPALARESRELERITRTAMAREPALRYPDVAALQADVRGFLAGQGDRRESDALTEAARAEFTALAKEVEDLVVTSPYYPRCTEIVAKAQQALVLWGINPRAVRVRQEALALFADLAVRGKDWGLAESVLRDLKFSGSGGHALAVPVEARLREQREKSRARDYIIRRMARVAAIGSVFMAGLSIYLYERLWETENRQAQAASTQTAAPTEPEPDSEFTPGADQSPFAPDAAPPPPREALSAALEPFQLPCDKATENAMHCLAGPSDLMLAWCESGPAWSWPSTGVPVAPRQLELPRGTNVLAAVWLDNRTAAVANAAGEVLTGVLPAAAPVIQKPWYRALNYSGAPIRAVAGWQDGPRLTVAVATDSRFLVQEAGSAQTWGDDLDAPVLCMQYVSRSTLFLVTRRSINALLPGSAKAFLQLREEYAAGAAARGAPCCALLPAARKDEVHVFEFDTATRKVSCTRLGGTGTRGVSCLAITAVGKLVAVGSSDGTVRLMGGSPSRILARVAVRSKPVRALEFSNDGHTLYAIDQGRWVHAWTVAGTKP
jgi:hypothetical protein